MTRPYIRIVPIGAHHEKVNRKGEKIDLLSGNGCRKWKDCFTCPLPECTFGQEDMYAKSKSSITN